MTRVIWTLWLQGWDRAPRVARACRATWEARNPGWEVQALSNETLRDHVDLPAAFPAVAGCWLDAHHFADLARLALLQRYGGVWVDATAYCTRPLDDWLAPHTGEGFFAFSLPGPRRLIANWFLAAAEGNPLLARWAAAADLYWSRRDAADDYYWPHRLFTDLYRSDENVRQAWDRVPHLAATGPHHFTPYQEELLRPVRPDDEPWLRGEAAPLLKLTRKAGGHHPPAGSVLARLCEEADALRSPVEATHR